MKTVSNLLAASICLGMSVPVYAQSAGMAATKAPAPISDAAKVKEQKHKPSAPAESATSDAKKNLEHREHSVKSVPPTAAGKVEKADKVDATRANLEKAEPASTVGKDRVAAHHEIKPAVKSAKPALKADPSVEATKTK
jgi:hypothetical protein